MFDFITYGADRLQILLLVLVRASGVFLVAPIFSNRALPKLFKVGFIVLLSILLVSAMPDMTMPVSQSLADLALLVMKELLLGILIGTMFTLIFYAVQAASSIAGYQMGLTMANVIDPSTQAMDNPAGQIWSMVALLIFMAINGHHLVLRAFYDSYAAIPAGQVILDGAAGELIIKYSAWVITAAVKLASPLIVTMFLTDLALGVVSRMLPTMNVFILSFGLKIAVGLLAIAVSLPVFNYMLTKMTGYINGEIHNLLLSLGKA